MGKLPLLTDNLWDKYKDTLIEDEYNGIPILHSSEFSVSPSLTSSDLLEKNDFLKTPDLHRDLLKIFVESQTSLSKSINHSPPEQTVKSITKFYKTLDNLLEGAEISIDPMLNEEDADLINNIKTNLGITTNKLPANTDGIAVIKENLANIEATVSDLRSKTLFATGAFENHLDAYEQTIVDINRSAVMPATHKLYEIVVEFLDFYKTLSKNEEVKDIIEDELAGLTAATKRLEARRRKETGRTARNIRYLRGILGSLKKLEITEPEISYKCPECGAEIKEGTLRCECGVFFNWHANTTNSQKWDVPMTQ